MEEIELGLILLADGKRFLDEDTITKCSRTVHKFTRESVITYDVVIDNDKLHLVGTFFIDTFNDLQLLEIKTFSYKGNLIWFNLSVEEAIVLKGRRARSTIKTQVNIPEPPPPPIEPKRPELQISTEDFREPLPKRP